MPDNQKTLLLDGDQIVWKVCAACEYEVNWGRGIWSLYSDESTMLQTAMNVVTNARHNVPESTHIKMAFSSSTNFRKDLDPNYKGQRSKRKPLGFTWLRDVMTEQYKAETWEGLEADDVIGIWAVEDPESVIWATDKDYLTVPCNLYQSGVLRHITEEQADKNLMIQTITGDTADNYKGVKGYGPKKATDWLDKQGYTWQAVYDLFIKNKQTEDEFVTNAKLARILRSKEDINWRPQYENKETT